MRRQPLRENVCDALLTPIPERQAGRRLQITGNQDGVVKHAASLSTYDRQLGTLQATLSLLTVPARQC